MVAEARQRHGEEADPRRAVPPIPQTQGAGAKEAAKRALQGTAPARTAANMYDGRAGQRDRGRKSGTASFELDMDGATLLGRRHKREMDGGATLGMAMGSPLAQADRTRQLPENPGSPMRID